jgi:hypothetical protein
LTVSLYNKKAIKGKPSAMFKVLAFVAGSMLASTAIIDAIAKPQYEQIRTEYRALQCERLGPDASVLIPSCN